MTMFSKISLRPALRDVIAGLISVSAMAAVPAAIASERFPDKPLTLVVGYSPGGQTDNIARMLATRLSEEIGQPVVVQNRDGAASTIAYRMVAQSNPDGYTIMFGGTSAHAIAPVLTQVAYDPTKDFRAIGKVSTLPLSISVNSSVPANNLQQLIELIKKNPADYSYATGGAGGIEHLAGEQFKQLAGLPELLHVPFKGGAPAATAVIGGQIPILINPLSTVFPYAQAGQLKVLAVTSDERMAAAPDYPTAVESGLPGFVASGFNVLLVPSKTPDAVVETLNRSLGKVMADPAFIKKLRDMKVNPMPASTPAETDAYLAAEMERWARTINAAHIKIN